jgi:hypothetical protein
VFRWQKLGINYRFNWGSPNSVTTKYQGMVPGGFCIGRPLLTVRFGKPGGEEAPQSRKLEETTGQHATVRVQAVARGCCRLVDIKVEQIDLKAATIHIRRAKKGTPGIHGVQGDELRLIRALLREQPIARSCS